MDKIPQSALNIRFFLWKKSNLRAQEWAKMLSDFLGCDRARAVELLWNGRLTPQELNLLTDATGVTEEVFLNSAFLEEKVEVLKLNIVFLFESLEHGGQKKFADSIGVSPVNIPRWKKGETKITYRHLIQVAQYFGIPRNVDLTRDPIFLSLTPYGDQERRQWLKKEIREIDEDTLRSLFPALERLFRK